MASSYHLERNLAKNIIERVDQTDSFSWSSIDLEKNFTWLNEHYSLQLAPGQREALTNTLRSRIAIITGGPGVGKTTIIHSIVALLQAHHCKVQLCAPTGKAAKRLTESTKCEAKTIHRLLEIDPFHGNFKRNKLNPLECDVLIIDEVSMVDIFLMDGIMKALPKSAGLFLLGDSDQLPSVGPGQLLKDMIDSKKITTSHLTEIFRQASHSHIIKNAYLVNKGEMFFTPPKEEESDFYFIEAEAPEQCVHIIKQLISHRIEDKFKFDPLKDIQILCPMNKGVLGARSLNDEIQKIFQPLEGEFIERTGWKYYVGDKVMQIHNDYNKEIYNGDTGIIISINHESSEVIIQFDPLAVVYDFDELEHVIPAYAITIHKSQGSEYPVVIIPIHMQHFVMLKKNLIYTAMTRGKKLVIMVGQRRAVESALKSSSNTARLTKLKEWLETL